MTSKAALRPRAPARASAKVAPFLCCLPVPVTLVIAMVSDVWERSQRPACGSYRAGMPAACMRATRSSSPCIAFDFGIWRLRRPSGLMTASTAAMPKVARFSAAAASRWYSG
jgi:hypothetical protein